MSAALERVLLEGLAARLDAAGVATYRPSGAYQAGDTPVVFGPLPASPDRVVGLTLYLAVDAQVENRSTWRVQARLRGTPGDHLDPGDLSFAIFEVLHGMEGVWFGALYVIDARRVSISPQGVDGNRRTERTDNYEFVVNTPVTPARPG